MMTVSGILTKSVFALFILGVPGLDAKAQTFRPDELVGKVSISITEKKIDQATKYTIEAAQNDSTILNAIFDFNIYQHLAYKDSLTGTCIQFLQKVRKAKSGVIRRKTESLFILTQLMYSKSKINEDSLLMRMWQLQEPELNTYTRNDIYLLKALHFFLTEKQKHTLIEEAIILSIERASLRSMPEGAPESMSEAQLVKRAQCRFRIREACYFHYISHGLTPQSDSVSMELLGTMNPDRFDRAKEFAFEADWVLLHGNGFWKEKSTGELPYGYHREYIQWLISKSDYINAFKEAAVQLYMFPSPANRSLYHEMAQKSGRAAEESEYFHQTFNRLSAPFPNMILAELSGQKDTFPSNKNTWMVGDIWGTWCPPCVEELPAIQHYSDSCHKLSNIHFVTFAFQSPGVTTFLEKKGYHFPVYPIVDSFNEQLHIEGFPMKIIISPEGKYRLLPYKKDWQTRIQELILEE